MSNIEPIKKVIRPISLPKRLLLDGAHLNVTCEIVNLPYVTSLQCFTLLILVLTKRDISNAYYCLCEQAQALKRSESNDFIETQDINYILHKVLCDLMIQYLK